MNTRILVIDDDEPFCGLVCRLLTKNGYLVDTAFDGKQGVRQFGAVRPDLVLTDIVMPGQEGLETISQLKKLDAKVPIIAMSGGGRATPESYLPLAEKLGADKTLAKPFEVDQLLQLIAGVLKKAGTQSP